MTTHNMSNKTQPTKASVKAFINQVEDEQKREDAFAIQAMMERITGEKAVMWGESIIGFGIYTYKYASGRTGDWPITGFSPRKSNLTIYVMPGFDKYEELLKKLGKHKLGKSCLYIRKLDDVDRTILEEIVADGVKRMRSKKMDECA